MPIKVQNNLPAKQILEHENIFAMDENRALSQQIRPLQIVILNLMPLKEDTEVQLLRSLSNTPLQVDITFLSTASYIGKNTMNVLCDWIKDRDEILNGQQCDALFISSIKKDGLYIRITTYKIIPGSDSIFVM